MARRDRSNSNNQSENTPNEVQEDNVSTTAPEVEASPEAVEAAVQANEDEAPATSDKPADKPVDLTAFNAAVTEAVGQRDEATGEVAPAVIEPVVVEYRKLDGLKAKNKAKAALNELMTTAMNALDISTARAYLMISDKLTAGPSGGGSTPRPPADPTEAFVQRTVGLRLALQLASDTVPEGVNDDWSTKAKALYDESLESARSYATWLASDAEDKGDEPEVSAVVKAAVKLSQGKAAKVGGKTSGGGSGFTGERRDIAKHILNAFEGQESGTFLSIAEIKNTASTEYGDASPSAGAISARLFPASGKCTVEGITPTTNDKGKKGAVKN